MHISGIIRELLIEDERSQNWLSKKTGIHHTKISKFLCGKGLIYANELILVLKAFNIVLVDDNDMVLMREEDYEDNKSTFPGKKTKEEELPPADEEQPETIKEEKTNPPTEEE